MTILSEVTIKLSGFHCLCINIETQRNSSRFYSVSILLSFFLHLFLFLCLFLFLLLFLILFVIVFIILFVFLSLCFSLSFTLFYYLLLSLSLSLSPPPPHLVAVNTFAFLSLIKKNF
jgi:hypothetical protein